jgi:hypothetical protein
VAVAISLVRLLLKGAGWLAGIAMLLMPKRASRPEVGVFEYFAKLFEASEAALTSETL